MAADQRLSKTTGIFVAAAAVQRAAPFLLLLVLAGTVPVGTFGQFGVMTSLSVLVVAIAGLGFEVAAFRGDFAITGTEEKASYYSNLSKIALGGPLVIMLPVVSVLWFAPGDLLGIDAKAFAGVIAGSTIYGAATAVPLARLRARGDVRSYVVCAVTPTLLQCATKLVACAVLDLGPAGWAIGDVVAGVCALCMTLPIQFRDLIAWPASVSETSALLRLSLPLLPHVISSWALSLSDRILVAGLVGATAAGQYSLVAQLVSVGMILCAELNRALAPEYGRVINGSQNARDRLARIVRIQRLISVAIFAAIAVGALVFILAIAPPVYREGAGWSLMLCSGMLIYAWYYPPMNVLSIVEGRTALMPLVTASSAAVNVGLNVLLLPSYGPTAAAYSTVVGYALLLGLTSLYAGRHPALSWHFSTVVVCAGSAAALLGAGTATLALG